MPTPLPIPVVGSYTGPTEVVFFGVNAYECKEDIIEFLRLSLDAAAAAAANIIQSTELDFRW